MACNLSYIVKSEVVIKVTFTSELVVSMKWCR